MLAPSCNPAGLKERLKRNGCRLSNVVFRLQTCATSAARGLAATAVELTSATVDSVSVYG